MTMDPKFALVAVPPVAFCAALLTGTTLAMAAPASAQIILEEIIVTYSCP